MVVVVPFDGSLLSRTALLHARQTSELYETTALAVTVIPDRNADYARENGWISSTEPFDRETIVSRLREQVTELAPEADFKHIIVDKRAQSGTVSSRIRRFARNQDTSAIFVGSKNAGHRLLGLESVGGRITSEPAYDIAIIRNPLPDAQTESAEANVQ